MANYMVEENIDHEYRSIKEIAKDFADNYGIVNYHGTPHNKFIQSLMECIRLEQNSPRMMKSPAEKIWVYDHEDILRKYIEEMLPTLENEKVLAVSLPDYIHGGEVKCWQVYWKPGLKVYKKKPSHTITIRKYKGSYVTVGKKLELGPWPKLH